MSSAQRQSTWALNTCVAEFSLISWIQILSRLTRKLTLFFGILRKNSVHSRGACQQSAKTKRRTYSFPETKENITHNYMTPSCRNVSQWGEKQLHSAKLIDLKKNSPFTLEHWRLIFMNKRIWRDGKDRVKKRGPTRTVSGVLEELQSGR